MENTSGLAIIKIIWAQQQKCAYETINNMERFVFAFFGAPKIMQSDNGKEFNN